MHICSTYITTQTLAKNIELQSVKGAMSSIRYVVFLEKENLSSRHFAYLNGRKSFVLHSKLTSHKHVSVGAAL
jgi:hypothetical protein